MKAKKKSIVVVKEDIPFCGTSTVIIHDQEEQMPLHVKAFEELPQDPIQIEWIDHEQSSGDQIVEKPYEYPASEDERGEATGGLRYPQYNYKGNNSNGFDQHAADEHYKQY